MVLKMLRAICCNLMQMDALRRGVDVVVGTPGRVMDLLERRRLVGDKVRFVVLDEADQMLDMGFQEDMEVILQQVRKEQRSNWAGNCGTSKSSHIYTGRVVLPPHGCFSWCGTTWLLYVAGTAGTPYSRLTTGLCCGFVCCVSAQMPAERQTMLFSATLPHWVQKVAGRYQRDPQTVDLVGEDQTGKLNEDVTLNVIQVRCNTLCDQHV